MNPSPEPVMGHSSQLFEWCIIQHALSASWKALLRLMISQHLG